MFHGVLFAAWILATSCVYGNTLTVEQGTDEREGLKGFLHPPFQCPDMSPSPTVPNSVEYVKAADIKVIAALGDSLTTAIGANGSTILSVPIEYRQVSWSIGGYGTYRDVITLANIFKLFNPTILGPAPVMLISGYPTTVNETGFNFAVTGHNTLVHSLVYVAASKEATFLLARPGDRFKGLNFQEDWKLVSMLIGMNDVCDYCKDTDLFSPDNFIRHMTEALDMMMNEIPRMIVNVVQIFPMEPLREVQRPTLACQLQKRFCSCLVLPEDNSPELMKIVEINLEFQKRLEELLHSDRYFKKDFAVVLQPYLKNTEPPQLPNGSLDLSFFAPDCFHFTIKGHEELAKGLWNNMFQPQGSKDMIGVLSEPVKLICPSQEHPYIYTRTSASPPLTQLSMATSTLVLLFHVFVWH